MNWYWFVLIVKVAIVMAIILCAIGILGAIYATWRIVRRWRAQTALIKEVRDSLSRGSR